jgi:membrane-associated protease RseP (regulator of RpoE activity)
MHTRIGLHSGWKLIACAAAAMVASVVTCAAADAPVDKAALEKQLSEAHARLDAAARDVARLSGELYGDSDLQVLKFVAGGPPGAMLGVNIGGSRDLDQGVEVVGVSPGGPAERAGLQAGDVVVTVDGQALKVSGDRTPAAQLVAFMRTVRPGQTVKVSYLRDGKPRDASVKAAPAEPAFARMMRDGMAGMPMQKELAMEFPGFPELMAPGGGIGRLEFVPMTPKLGKYFGTDKGLLVVRASRETGLPLEEGDVLLTIGGRTPESAGQAFRILLSYEPQDKVQLGILRDRKRIEVEGIMPSRPALARPMHPGRVAAPPPQPPLPGPPVQPKPAQPAPPSPQQARPGST